MGFLDIFKSDTNKSKVLVSTVTPEQEVANQKRLKEDLRRGKSFPEPEELEKPKTFLQSLITNQRSESDVMSRDIIARIHLDFDTAADKKTKELQELIEKSSVTKKLNDALYEKAAKMKSLGFVNAKEVQEVHNNKFEIDKDEKRIEKLKSSLSNVRHFQSNYPFLKFLSYEDLDRICEKYNLVYSSVEDYIQTIPDKNLQEILSAKELDNMDRKCGLIVKVRFSKGTVERYLRNTSDYNNPNIHILRMGQDRGLTCVHDGSTHRGYTGNVHNIQAKTLIYNGKTLGELFPSLTIEDIFSKRELEDKLYIAAPLTYFKEGTFKDNVYRPVPDDPIVFRLVKGGLQSLSKWGDEGNDIDLQVGIMN